MHLGKQKCPNCGKSSGLMKVGEDFEHVVQKLVEVDVPVEERLLAPVKINDDGTVLTMPTVIKKVVRQARVQDVKIKRPGSFCRKCSWSSPDKLEKHYEAGCSDCGKNLGRWGHSEDGKPKTHFCPECSKARVEKGAHDPDEAMVTFVIPCAGCGEDLNYISFPEGDMIERPPYVEMDAFCSKEGCQTRALATVQLNRLLAGESPPGGGQFIPCRKLETP